MPKAKLLGAAIVALALFAGTQLHAQGGEWIPGYGQQGWFQYSSGTSLTGACPPNNYNGTSYAWTTYCPNVENAWGGGTYDQANHRMVIFGGGHVDYPGNEVYTLNLGTSSSDPLAGTMNLLYEPTTATQTGATGPANLGGSCVGWLADSRGNGNWPNSRHTYYSLSFVNGNLYFWGGGVTCAAGGNISGAGYYNLAGNSWTRIDSGGPGYGGGSIPGDCGTCTVNNFNDASAANPNNGHVYFSNGSYGGAQTYDWNGTTSTAVLTNSFANSYYGFVYDSVDNLLFEYGFGDFHETTPGTWGSWSAASCNSTCASAVTGTTSAAYDSVNDVIYFWPNSGGTVYKYAPKTSTWTAISTNTNPCQQSGSGNGSFNRFQFDSTYQVGILQADPTQQACVWWPQAAQNSNGWASRSTGTNVPGGSSSIVSSYNFDSSLTLPNCTSTPCVYSNTGGSTETGAQWYYVYYHNQPNSFSTDCTIASDGCSLKETILNGYFQGEPGTWDYNFCAALNSTCQYGNGQEFYIQWMTRLDPGMLGSNPPGAEGFKQAIVAEGATPTKPAEDCTNSPAEIVPIQDINGGAVTNGMYPWIYMNCGDSGGAYAFMQSAYQPFQMSSGSDYLDQIGTGCPHYGGRGIPTTVPTCWAYVANEWETIQLHVKIGTFEHPNSTVDIWYQHPGQPAVLVSNAADAAIDNDGSGGASGLYGKIQLSAYNTNASWNVNTAVWFDDLIVSTRRIPDPNVSTPNAPDSLSLSNISASSVTVNWRVNSQNGTAQDDTGFLVERCTGIGTQCLPNPQSGFTHIGTTSAGASSYVDHTVVTGTTYTYRVRASNLDGTSGYAESQCFNNQTGSCGGTILVLGNAPPAPATGMLAMGRLQ